MRSIGFITEYLPRRGAGRSHGYGFIRGEHGDLYFQLEDCAFRESEAIVGLRVSFEVVRGAQRGKGSAVRVNTLEQEKDPATIKYCAAHRDPEIWVPVLPSHARSLTPDELASYIEDRLGTLPSDMRLSFLERFFHPALLITRAAYMRAIGLSERAEKLLDWLQRSGVTIPGDVYFQELTQALTGMPKQKRDTLMCRVPTYLLEASKGLRRFLEPPDRITVLIKLLSAPESKAYDDYVAELVPCLADGATEAHWDSMPDPLVQHPDIWAHTPVRIRARKLLATIKRLDDEQRLDEMVPALRAFTGFMARATPEGRLRLAGSLPETAFFVPELYQGVSLRVLAALLARTPANAARSIWPVWSQEQQALYLAGLLSAGEPPEDLPIDKARPLVAALHALIEPDSQYHQAVAFFRSHGLFLDYVLERASNWNDPLTDIPLIPQCPQPDKSGVIYCEGKPWPTFQRRDKTGPVAYCPRLCAPCQVQQGRHQVETLWDTPLQGARLQPVLDLPVEEWTWLEVCEAAGTAPSLPELRASEAYATKLGGWVNRLRERREHLKCRCCQLPMVSDFEYSKKLEARFNATVFKCDRGPAHDKDVYLNQCWACRGLIDNRDCTQKVEQYYLCLHCGSGPEKSGTYTQGRQCPNCGSQQMSRGEGRRRQCQDCYHVIRLPDSRFMTGPAVVQTPAMDVSDDIELW